MTAASDAEPVRVALWAHCAVEYLLGLMLISQAVGARRGALVVAVAGACVALPAAFSGSAISVGHWIGPRAHRSLDMAIAVAIAVAPFVWPVAPLLSFALVETVAALTLWLSLRTRYSKPPRRARRPLLPARPQAPVARTIGRYVGQLSRFARRPTE